MRRRLLLGLCALLFVPVALLIAGSVGFLSLKVPELAESERLRVREHYREIADRLSDNFNNRDYPREADTVKRPKKAFKMKPGRWGFEEAERGRVRIWYAEGDKSIATVVDPVAPSLTVYWYVLVIVGVCAGLVVVTVFGARYFHKYVVSREDFLSATAHDLTTPLVGMRMMIGLNDEEARRLNERMLLIVSNIKDFMRLGGKRRAPQTRRFDLVAACLEAYNLFAADYEDSESGAVEFDCSRLEAGRLEVFADETMTMQILWNLFGNDLKYAAPDGRVAVRFAADAGAAQVEFVDEGQGMTPAQMRRAFDRYYRAKTVLESGKGGFGIGLCTAREFARAMRGDLTVRANSPRGCVFTLSLPTHGEGGAKS